MPQNRYYSSTAQATTLSAGVTAVATTIPVGAVTGFPVTYPYTLVIDSGTSNAEVVKVTSAAGLNLTAVRAQDGTSGVTHNAGATVIHSHTGQDFNEPQAHIAASGTVHGVAGNVVGTTDAQALTNKDLTSATNTFPSSVVTENGSQIVTNKDLTAASNTFPASLATDAEVTAAVSAHAALTTAHGVAGVVVGTTDAQTLTNKTLASPVVTGVGELRFISKTADESVTSSTVLQDDNELSFSVAANATYVVEGTVLVTSTGGVGGVKMALGVPAAAAYAGGVPTATVGTTGGFSGTVFYQLVAGFSVVGFTLSLVTAGTAGTATLQWAQLVSDAGATKVEGGSFLVVRRVA